MRSDHKNRLCVCLDHRSIDKRGDGFVPAMGAGNENRTRLNMLGKHAPHQSALPASDRFATKLLARPHSQGCCTFSGYLDARAESNRRLSGKSE
jgi:hypothetical protein